MQEQERALEQQDNKSNSEELEKSNKDDSDSDDLPTNLGVSSKVK